MQNMHADLAKTPAVSVDLNGKRWYYPHANTRITWGLVVGKPISGTPWSWSTSGWIGGTLRDRLQLSWRTGFFLDLEMGKPGVLCDAFFAVSMCSSVFICFWTVVIFACVGNMNIRVGVYHMGLSIYVGTLSAAPRARSHIPTISVETCGDKSTPAENGPAIQVMWLTGPTTKQRHVRDLKSTSKQRCLSYAYVCIYISLEGWRLQIKICI